MMENRALGHLVGEGDAKMNGSNIPILHFTRHGSEILLLTNAKVLSDRIMPALIFSHSYPPTLLV